MSRPRIVVVGSSNTDLVVAAERLPGPGETVLGGEFLIAAGGKGANQAVAAARLGAATTLVARLGDDDFGERAREALRAEGVDTGFVVTDPERASGVALIVVDAAGENQIAVAPGANAALCPADVDRAGDVIARADALLLQLEIPLAAVEHAARLAADAGVPVILDPAPAAPLPRELLARVSILTPNEGEASLLAGVEVEDESSARAAAAELRARGVATVVVTLGPRGAYLSTAGHELLVPAPEVVAVDATAAGDVFAGALACALARGHDLPTAVAHANHAAALSTTRRGAQPSMPTRAELDRGL